MMKLRDQAYARSRSTKVESDKTYYKDLKRVVNQALFNEKAAYFRFNINEQSKNPKELWKNFKLNVTNFKNKQYDLPANINDPNLINNHFLNIDVNHNISISELTYFNSNRCTSAIFSLKTVDETVISKIICNIASNVQGSDGITRDMIQLTLPRTLATITAIVNQSIKTGVFPDIWKKLWSNQYQRKATQTT